MDKCLLEVVLVFPKSNNIVVRLQDKTFASDLLSVYQSANLRPEVRQRNTRSRASIFLEFCECMISARYSKTLTQSPGWTWDTSTVRCFLEIVLSETTNCCPSFSCQLEYRTKEKEAKHSEYLLLECAQIGISSQVGAITSCLHAVRLVLALHGSRSFDNTTLTIQGIALSLENPHVPILGAISRACRSRECAGNRCPLRSRTTWDVLRWIA
jgi:hypothetical protein